MAVIALTLFGLTLTLGLSSAFAGKEPIATFGPSASGAVAVNQTTGEVYVQDYAANKIQRFDADGNFISEFGSEGSGDGQLNFGSIGTGLAVDPADGDLYVADVGNHRVQRFDEDGNYLSQFGSEGSANGQFNGFVMGIAVNPSNGDVFVADTGNHRVQRFDSSGNYVARFGSSGSDDGQFNNPRDVAVDSTGHVYVLDRQNARVQKFSPTGSFESVFYVPPPNENGPRQVEVDPATDHVFISQPSFGGATGHILELSPAGEQVDVHLPFGLSEGGLALNSSSGRIYAAGSDRIAILDDVTPPAATLAPTAVTGITTTEATFHGSVNPGGEPAAYRFEYSADGVEWIPVPDTTVDVGSGSSDVPVEQSVSGLEPGKTYHLRLFANRPLFGGTGAVTSAETTFTMDPVPPVAETVSWPYRASTSVNLAARINPRNTQTSYYFEYGPTDSYGSKLPASEDGDAGAGGLTRLVLQELSGLEPGETIHYRVIASNVAGTVTGEDQTIETRLTDVIAGHGRVAGPPGSDRGYEQVNLPDTNGNPAGELGGVSSDGNRALYTIPGGTSISQGGRLTSPYIAERTEAGWVSMSIQPPRSQADVSFSNYPAANFDLSKVANFAEDPAGVVSFWELFPDRDATTVGDTVAGGINGIGGLGSSQDLSTHIVSAGHLFELTPTGREQVDILPNGSPSQCGPPATGLPDEWAVGSPPNIPFPERYQIASDGSYFLFNISPDDSCGPTQLYIRHEGSAGTLASGQTDLVSGPVVSGPEWPALFAGATPGGPKDPSPTVFLWTRSRLTADDEEQPDDFAGGFYSDGGDIYSYDVTSKTLDCLTCVVSNADVIGGGSFRSIAVAHDGSRIYFSSQRAFFEGQGVEGAINVYRYDVASEDLAYVATPRDIAEGGTGGTEAVGVDTQSGQALSEDGSVLIFRSKAASLNQLSGSDNGGFQQYYRYDDSDRSVVCVSCPQSGTPTRDVKSQVAGLNRRSPRITPVSADGDFYFATTDPLLPPDQNTASPGQSPESGTDIYEWRDGQLLLVTDGITSHAADQQPRVMGSTASGRDVFFTMTARLTPDVTDGFAKLFDARIGGGFDFPPPPPPCSLDACQGEAKGPPEDVITGSSKFAGSGNPKPNARKRAKARCKAKQRHGRSGKEAKRALRKCQGKSKSRASNNAKHG